MILLIEGTPDSGKSKIAEDKAVAMCDNGNLIYLATMLVYDNDGEARLIKHRNNRAGKGFKTIELPYKIDRALELINNPNTSTVLLECITNLAGNELFENTDRDSSDISTLAMEVVGDIKRLANGVSNLIIVTNKFTVSADMDQDTVVYISLIGKINAMLRTIADEIISMEDNKEN